MPRLTLREVLSTDPRRDQIVAAMLATNPKAERVVRMQEDDERFFGTLQAKQDGKGRFLTLEEVAVWKDADGQLA